MKVTRILNCKTDNASKLRLNSMADSLSLLRSEIWRRYGALQNVGKAKCVINKEIRKSPYYKNILVSGNVKCEVVNDTVHNILMYKEAAKAAVRKEIFRIHKKDKPELKRLYTLLKADKWLENKFLHRRMRFHFKHGVSKMNNQILFMSQNQSVISDDTHTFIKLDIPKKFGGAIYLSISGNETIKKYLDNKNLRLIIKKDIIEVHYSFDKEQGRPCGTKEIGIDKGYTEAFVDSEGEFYVEDFGLLTTRYSDKESNKGKSRNKLHAISKKYKAKGNYKKAQRIKKNNLGYITKNRRKTRIHNQLKDRVNKAVHKLVDKAGVLVSEDLTSQIKGKGYSKNMNRKLSNWYKGILASSIENITTQRGCKHLLVNPAYTSQMDSNTQRLEGKRVGDKFYHASGAVSQSDYNASRNILARASDSDIPLYMPYKEVKRILLARNNGDVNTAILDLSCNDSFDKVIINQERISEETHYFGSFGVLT